MRNILNTLSAIGALAMAATPLLAVGSLAHGAEATVRPAYIQLAGLHLSRASDAATFHSRVDVAANAICGQDSERTINSRTACVDAVRDEAVEKLGADQRRDLRSGAHGWSMAAR